MALTTAITLFVTACLITMVILAAPIQDENRTRRIWDNDLIKSKKSSKTTARTRPKRSYRVVTPKVPTDGVDESAVLGITVWRLRPSTQSDDNAARILKHKDDNANVSSWTPERVSADTPLAAGQRVRLSIEAARTGYLYVIDREQYADGTLSEPYLIFPTSRIMGGENQVSVGRIVDLPAVGDDPNYFTLDPSRPDQIGELLSVIISPEPLPDLKIESQELKLSSAQVDEWEKQWGTNVGQLDLEGGAGKTWTTEEKAAAATRKSLNNDAPAPQTLYYRPNVKSGDPLLVSLKLSYGKETRKKP